MLELPHESDDDVVDVHARCHEQASQVSQVISMAQGMCTDERPYEEINVILDVAQRVLNASL